MKKIYMIGVAALMTACSGGGNGETAVSTEEKVDTVVEVKKVIERLPDTTYASAGKIRYNVEVLQPEVDGTVSSLDDMYAGQPSIMTFRGGPFRQAAFGGKLDTVPTRLEVAWRVETESDAKWYGGSGWTGQPMYIEWPDSLSRRLKDNNLVTSDFNGREIMVGSLCGMVYFLNPDNGKYTRQPIGDHNPIKGTVSFDPTFNGFLYVGSGIPSRRPFGAYTIDLFRNKIVEMYPEDPKALRHWGAYDSSVLRIGQFIFRPAENGSFYKYLVTSEGPKLHSVLRYRIDGAAPGIESSMAVYANYGIMADNHGNILAVNLDNMQPVWQYALGDDTDSTPVIIEEEDGAFVYIGSEIDRSARGYAVFAKLKVADGTEVWRIQPPGRQRSTGDKFFDGGFYSTPLPGQADCSDLLFTTMVQNTNGANGVFMAINRADGKIVYEVPLKHYAWSSPVGFVTAKGEQVVLQGDCAGNMYIIEGKTGRITGSKTVGFNFESSPVTVGNAVIVGSRTNGILKVELR